MEKKSRILTYVVLAVFFVLLIICLVFGALLFGSGEGRQVQVEIEPGSSIDQIAEVLVEKDVLSSKFLFVVAARYQGLAGKLLPGKYEMRQGMSYFEVLDILKKGPAMRIFKITIPEGYTIDQTAEKLKKETTIDSGEFVKFATDKDLLKKRYDFLESNSLYTLEGYLFPKTYHFKQGTTAEGFIGALLEQFSKETSRLDWTPAASRGLSIHQIVTIASMIESEAKVPDERPLVAAVIYNRLANNMLLNIDATVQYALPERKARLTAQDLEVDSSYNTYKHLGLPPGPICNPGLASIKAALNPANVDYLYYVLVDSSTGKHEFTNSYQEFLKIKRQAQK